MSSRPGWGLWEDLSQNRMQLSLPHVTVTVSCNCRCLLSVW